MTTITMAEWLQSPDIVVGEREHRRLVTAALTDISEDADQIDFLLYELDRAKVMNDDQLPADIVRLNSIVRYRSGSGGERTIKLVLPDENTENTGYRLTVTSMHGAALLGLRPGQALSWLVPEGTADRVDVISVANSGSRRR